MKLCFPLIFSVFISIGVFAQTTREAAVPYFEIASIKVEASGGSVATDPEEYVLSHIFAKPGAFISAESIANDQRSLLDTGTFSDVKVLSNPASGTNKEKVDLVYRVVIAPRFLAPLTSIGNEAFSDRKVRRILDLTAGDRIDQARLDAKCDKLKEEYRQKYYYGVKIISSISQPDSEGFSTVTVRIDEGKKARISGFEYTGNTHIKSSELNSVLGKPSWYNPVPFFYYTWRQQALDFEHVRDLIVTHYRDLGYLDVTVSDPVLSEADGSAPVLKVDIKEGPLYFVETASVTGVTLFPEKELTSIADTILKPGFSNTDHPASAKDLAQTTKFIREYFTSRGYADTTVRLTLNPINNGTAAPGTAHVAAEFAVTESELAHIRSVSIRGNTRTRDKVIRRELMVTPGMILNEVYAERSKKRIENLGYFDNVRYHESPSRENQLERDLVYEVNEKNTGQLMVGIGTSSIDDILGYLEISQSNFDIANWPTFRGGGQKAKLSVEIGSNSNSGEISWTDPWFLDRRQSLTVDLYRRETSYSEYDDTRIGGGVTYGLPLRYGRINARLGAEHVGIDDVIGGHYTLQDDPGTEFAFTDIEDTYMRIPLRLSWLYDSRDRYLVPTSGAKNNFFAEATSSSFGSEYDLYKVGCDLRGYVPLWLGHIFSVHIRAEAIDSYGDTDEVPVPERLFLGGGRSIRGYKYRQVGPKAIPDETTGGRARPVGGQTLALFSAEYNIPIAGFMRFASFFDIGNTWSDPFDIDMSEYASSWGLGIRFDIPGFPIRLDYAFPLNSDDDYTRKEHFVFWIGID